MKKDGGLVGPQKLPNWIYGKPDSVYPRLDRQVEAGEATIPLDHQLPDGSCDLTRKLHTGRAQTLPYLILLRAEFGCFHSSSSLKTSRSRSQDQCPGHSLCSTVPRLTTGGH